MRAIHHAADRLNGWLVARRQQAPIASDLADLEELSTLAERDPRALLRPVESAAIAFDPEEGARSKVETFAFSSPAPFGDSANDRVHGERWLAADRPSKSAIVMLHGGFAPSWLAERLMAHPFLAKRIDVFVIALPWHMDRAPSSSGYSGQYLLSGDVPRLVRGFSQGAHDAAALVLALRQQGYRRVFVSGISLGGNIAAQTASLAVLDGVFLLIPAIDPFQTIFRSPIGAGMARAASNAGFDDREIERAMRLVTPHFAGLPKSDPDAFRVVHGTYDLFCSAEAIEEFVQAWSITQVQSLKVGHRTFAINFRQTARLLAHDAGT